MVIKYLFSKSSNTLRLTKIIHYKLELAMFDVLKKRIRYPCSLLCSENIELLWHLSLLTAASVFTKS